MPEPTTAGALTPEERAELRRWQADFRTVQAALADSQDDVQRLRAALAQAERERDAARAKRPFPWGTFWCALFLTESYEHGAANLWSASLSAALTAGVVLCVWCAWRWLAHRAAAPPPEEEAGRE